jgi:hypothetical protein
MPNWNNKSAKFQRNMRALSSAEDDFAGDDPMFAAPEVFNENGEKQKVVAGLRLLLDGVERGEYRIDNLTVFSVPSNQFVQSLDGRVLSALSGNVTEVTIGMTISPNPLATYDDDYPTLEPARKQVGASPPRLLILDSDDD